MITEQKKAEAREYLMKMYDMYDPLIVTKALWQVVENNDPKDEWADAWNYAIAVYKDVKPGLDTQVMDNVVTQVMYHGHTIQIDTDDCGRPVYAGADGERVILI